MHILAPAVSRDVLTTAVAFRWKLTCTLPFLIARLVATHVQLCIVQLLATSM